MKIISFPAWKGGVGKTTILYTIATQLSLNNKNILIIDFDPQSSITKLIEKPNNLNLKIGTLIKNKNENINNYINESIFKNIDHINGDDDLFFYFQKIDVNLIKHKLKQITKKYDYILLDTPPNINYLTYSVYKSCDHLILISDPSIMSLSAIASFYKYWLSQSSDNKIDGLIVNNINHYHESKMFIQQLENSSLKHLLIKPYIKKWEIFNKITKFHTTLKELNHKKGELLINKLIVNLMKKNIL